MGHLSFEVRLNLINALVVLHVLYCPLPMFLVVYLPIENPPISLHEQMLALPEIDALSLYG